MATIKEQDIVLVSKEADGTKVIQMPITRVENVEGGIATINGVKPDNFQNVTLTQVDTATNANRAKEADSAVKATQDGSGRIITNTYATKDELATKLNTDQAFTKNAADNLYLGKTDTAVAATKALQDNLGNNIANTYATKLELNPLANKAEVLTHSAQTLTPEQKAQVVKNLEGTFLPLSGGTVTGQIHLGSTLNGLIQTNDDLAQFSGNSGSEIDIWSKGSQYEGIISLLAKDSRTNRFGQLNVSPDDLLYNNQAVERVDSRGGNAQYGWIRYTNGIQICWSINVATNELGGTAYGYPVPFASAPYVVASLLGTRGSAANWSFVYEDHVGEGKTGINIWLMFNGNPAPNNLIRCFAFGLWK